MPNVPESNPASTIPVVVNNGAQFQYIPSTATKGKSVANVVKMSYGDRYEQRSSYGINNVVRSWDLDFQIEDGANIAAIDALLTNFSGMPFTWQQPFPYDGQGVLSWTCDEWDFTYDTDGGRQMGLTATFAQAFTV